MARKYARKMRRLKRAGENSDAAVFARSVLKNTRVRIVIGVLLAVALVIGGYLWNKYKTYDGYKVLESIDIESGNGSRYVPFMDFVVKYSSEGISYIDGNETVWDEAYEMKSPIVDVCDEYLVIADKNTNDIFLYNEEGKQGKITTSYPIVKIEVARQGVVAALLENKKTNYIEVYNKEGKKLVSHKTLIDENGYPLDFSLSEDGVKMAVSYLTVNNGTMKNKIQFYNFSTAGKNAKGRVVGTFEQYKESIVPLVQFVSDKEAVALGEDIFSIYKVKDKPDLKKEVSLRDEIQKVFFSEKYIGFVFNNHNSEKPYRMEVYNMSGNRVMKKDIEMNFNTILFAEDNVLMYDDMNCQIISLKGVKKFEYTFKGQVNEIIPIDNDRTYLFMTNSAIEKVRLK